MAKRYAIVLILLVVVPVLAFLALGWRNVDSEKQIVEQRFRNLLARNLAEMDRSILGYFTHQQRQLDRLVKEMAGADDYRNAARSHPIIQQIVQLDTDGAILFPDLNGAISDRERMFLMRMERILVDKDILAAASGNRNSARYDQVAASSVKRTPRKDVQQTSAAENEPLASGWYTWFWGKGVQLIHWTRLDDGRVVACCLSRARWTADLVERLPNTVPSHRDGRRQDRSKAAPPLSLVRLVDSEDRTIYQWGEYEPDSSERSLAAIDLTTPLASWRLQHFGPPETLESGGNAARMNLFIAAGLLGASLIGLAIYLSREMGRSLREATQRVNFVNQVSHELKTPLTNIRMYADLLHEDLQRTEHEDVGTRKHLAVISDESNRLSRLIANVLTFAQHRRSTMSLHSRPLLIDEIIKAVVRQFQPSLDRLGIKVDMQLNVTEPITADEDSLGQILGNLISNVEKYAVDGKWLGIESRQSGDTVIIDVIDRGPGIPASHRESIFEPFERISDRIESATGTGIGLSIARQLARLHGGDLELVDGNGRAHFQVSVVDQSPSQESTPEQTS